MLGSGATDQATCFLKEFEQVKQKHKLANFTGQILNSVVEI